MKTGIDRQVMALGDEAAALAAIDAGVKGVFAYPGTPSTEIFECAEAEIEKMSDGRVTCIGANEKVAYEFALGASYKGHRAMVTMKHVGLNVAMDAFVNSALTGVQGGLVVAVADDPSMHSSQNEQDSRYLADFASIPVLEPSTPQEVYDLTIHAFDLSEKLKLPVLLRLVTRLAHARGMIIRKETAPVVDLGIPSEEESKNWVLIPAIARQKYQKLRDMFPQIVSAVESFNSFGNTDNKAAVVSSGMGTAYFYQLCRTYPELKKLGHLAIASYPLKVEILQEALDKFERIFVFEENYPFIEDRLIARSRPEKNTILGRRDGRIPIAGELTLYGMAKALEVELPVGKNSSKIEVPQRPPRFCDGCGHIDAFNAIKEAYKMAGVEQPRSFGDIGCYTLGVMPPFEGIHACVEMGASLGMALGAALTGMGPSVGIIGDSTFFHSGLPTLVTFARSKVNANFVVMDNRITAMTGQQETVATDIIPDIAKACGLKEDQIHLLTPLPKKHQENVELLTEVFKKDRPDLIIFKRECVQALRKGLYKKIDAK